MPSTKAKPRPGGLVKSTWCVRLVLCITGCSAIPVIPNLPFECYTTLGDLNLASIAGPMSSGSDGKYCGERFYRSAIQHMEAVNYAILEINKRSDLLPNITLGHVVVSDCRNRQVALARATYFVPDEAQTRMTSRKNENDNCRGGPRLFDVVGVIGNGNSPTAAKVSGFLGLYQVPFLDTLASSDELSAKRWYPYYLRLVPPDRYLIRAMFDFIVLHNWTYASVVYAEGTWGENAEKLVQAYAKEEGLCIPVAERVRAGATEEDMEPVLNKLVANSNARLVFNFMYDSMRPVLWSLIRKRNLIGRFIFIASDSMSSEHEGPAADGTFVMFQVTKPIPAFTEYYQGLTPQNMPQNPWFPRLWEELYDCTWDTENTTAADGASCNSVQDKPYRNQRVWEYVTLYLDTALVYANAIHKLLEDKCPEAFRNKNLLKTCIRRPDVLAYLRVTDLMGYNGRTKFDENGDKIGQYKIKQYFHDHPDLFTTVAHWDQMSNTLTVYNDKIRWDTFMEGDKDRMPESVCSKPCKPKEYFIRQELPCCWECLECRNNEKIVNNNTGCERCPTLSWPDEETMTKCEVIAPNYMRWLDPVAIGLFLSSLFIAGLTVIIMVWFAQHQQIKLIKASSIELSSIILLGILMAVITIPFFLMRPSFVGCTASRAGFGISVTLIYAPLMVKTTRIYRIFNAGKKGTAKPRFISNKAQMFGAIWLLFIQICLSLVSGILAPPEAALRMPVLTVRYVELYCDLPLKGLLPPLAFNLVLLTLCGIFGFLTRKLPENFNESWYIFVSVSTTMFLWTVFLPTYFTTFYIIYRVVLLSSCLFINAVITLICLFVPKIYAVHFINEEKLMLMAPGGSAVNPSVTGTGNTHLSTTTSVSGEKTDGPDGAS